jgi:hypothetical protein
VQDKPYQIVPSSRGTPTPSAVPTNG